MSISNMTSSNALAGVNAVESTTSAAATETLRGNLKAQGSTSKAGTHNSSDKAIFSSAGGLVLKSAGDSDVRTAKVAALQLVITSGRYLVPTSDVADKVMASLMQ